MLVCEDEDEVKIERRTITMEKEVLSVLVMWQEGLSAYENRSKMRY